jgi:excisionase family DNA binding protein
MVSMPGENQRSSNAQRVAPDRPGQRVDSLPLGLSGAEAAALLGVSESHFYNLHRTGRLGPLPVRMGRAVRWSRTELVDWFEAGSPPRTRWRAMRAANN